MTPEQIAEARVFGRLSIASGLGVSPVMQEAQTAPIKHPNGSKPRPIGKYVSVSECARRLGVTRQEVKKIMRNACPPCNNNCNQGRDCPARRTK